MAVSFCSTNFRNSVESKRESPSSKLCRGRWEDVRGSHLSVQGTSSFFLFHMYLAFWSFSETSSIIPVFHKERGSEKSSNISILASEWERYDPSLVLTDKLHCLSFTSCCLIYGSNPISSLCSSQLLAFLYTSCLKADQLYSRRCQLSNMCKSKAVPGLWQWQKGKSQEVIFCWYQGKNLMQ